MKKAIQRWLRHYLRVLYALLRDDDILWLAQEDKPGKALPDLNLETREQASKKEQTLRKLHVYADFDHWLKEIAFIEMGYEPLRDSFEKVETQVRR